jgi:hypothetical protein
MAESGANWRTWPAPTRNLDEIDFFGIGKYLHK